LVNSDFKRGRQVIRTVKYADDLVLMAKEETVIKGAINSLNDIGICYGIEMYVEITEVIRIPRKPSPVQIIIDKKTTGECGSFRLFGQLTNDARCTRRI